jgi:hypothetical protein
MRKRALWVSILCIAALIPALGATAVTQQKEVMGKNGEILTVSKNAQVTSGQAITVSGRRFDETVGIYIAFCKVVTSGTLPTPCGGGVDQSGSTGASIWISSNPPSYGVGLAKPYLPGGRFKVTVKISPKIGKIDCRKTKCAIYVRADHTRADDRSRDLYIPITFK